jgi:hypothetical protein
MALPDTHPMIRTCFVLLVNLYIFAFDSAINSASTEHMKVIMS